MNVLPFAFNSYTYIYSLDKTGSKNNLYEAICLSAVILNDVFGLV